jgi:hypothetical protein
MSRVSRVLTMVLAGLAAILAAGCLVGTASAFALVPRGGIQGTITDPTGITGVAGLRLDLYEATSSAVPTATVYTQATGDYEFGNLPSGRDYFMRISDVTWPYVWASEVYHNHFPAFLESADPIHVSAGSTTTVSATMTPAAAVDGSIHRMGHPEEPVSGAQLYIIWMGENPDRASTLSEDTTSSGIIQPMRGLTPGPWMIWAWMHNSPSALYGSSSFGSDIRTLSPGATTTVDIGLPLKPVTVSNEGSGWHKAPFLFQLTVTDGDLPPFTPHIYFGPHAIDADLSALTIASDTSQTIWFWSKDASGNVEPTKSVDVHVDATPPETTCTAVPGAICANLRLSGSDALSGLAGTYYRIDGGAAKLYGGPVAMPAGTHDVHYWSVDRAGNSEAIQTIHIVNPPAVVLGKPSSARSVTHNKGLKVSGSISPLQKKGDRSTKLYAYRASGSTWKLIKIFSTISVRVSGKSRYSATIKLTTKGSWELLAYSPGTYAHRWPGWSVARYVKVK